MKRFRQKPFHGSDGQLVTDKASLDYWSEWEPSSGHPGGWRVTRGISPLQEAEGKTGRLRLFRSIEGAKRAADQLNKKGK